MLHDVVLGRSGAALECYPGKRKGKDRVRVVCKDLSSTYPAIVRKHFPRLLSSLIAFKSSASSTSNSRPSGASSTRPVPGTAGCCH